MNSFASKCKTVPARMSQSVSTEGYVFYWKHSLHNVQRIHREWAALIYMTMSVFIIFSSMLNNPIPFSKRCLSYTKTPNPPTCSFSSPVLIWRKMSFMFLWRLALFPIKWEFRIRGKPGGRSSSSSSKVKMTNSSSPLKKITFCWLTNTL